MAKPAAAAAAAFIMDEGDAIALETGMHRDGHTHTRQLRLTHEQLHLSEPERRAILERQAGVQKEEARLIERRLIIAQCNLAVESIPFDPKNDDANAKLDEQAAVFTRECVQELKKLHDPSVKGELDWTCDFDVPDSDGTKHKVPGWTLFLNAIRRRPDAGHTVKSRMDAAAAMRKSNKERPGRLDDRREVVKKLEAEFAPHQARQAAVDAALTEFERHITKKGVTFDPSAKTEDSKQNARNGNRHSSV